MTMLMIIMKVMLMMIMVMILMMPMLTIMMPLMILNNQTVSSKAAFFPQNDLNDITITIYNIARGTTDPGYCLFNLSYLFS